MEMNRIAVILVLVVVGAAQELQPGSSTMVSLDNVTEGSTASSTVISKNPHLRLDVGDAPGRPPVPAVPSPNITMCQVCQCPDMLTVRPYDIVCKNQNTIPIWEDVLLDNQVEDVRLNFDSNHLERVLRVRHVRNLEYLSFRSNYIRYVDPFAIADLPSLKYLSLSHNKLDRIHPNAFTGHNQSTLPLEILDLGNNKLHSFDEDLFDSLYNLFELNLANNPIKVFDASTTAALNALHKLGMLVLSQTGIKFIKSELVTPIRSLQVLVLNGNKLESIPKVLQHAENLRELNLNGNPIRNFTRDSFVGMPRLEVLNISAMPLLTQITEGTLAPTLRLSALFCSFNPSLTFISPWVLESADARGGKELRVVHLRQNALLTLEENTFPWRLLEVVDVEGNPFVCDCHLRWLRKLIFKDPELTLNLVCKNPEEVRDQPLMRVEERIFDICDARVAVLHSPYNHQEMQSASLSTKIIVTSVIVCCGVLIISAAIYVIRKRRRDKTWAKKSWVHYSKAESQDIDREF